MSQEELVLKHIIENKFIERDTLEFKNFYSIIYRLRKKGIEIERQKTKYFIKEEFLNKIKKINFI